MVDKHYILSTSRQDVYNLSTPLLKTNGLILICGRCGKVIHSGVDNLSNQVNLQKTLNMEKTGIVKHILKKRIFRKEKVDKSVNFVDNSL